MMDVGRHPQVEVMTMTEVISCEGEPGNYKVQLRKKPRYVHEDICVACGLCVDACPEVIGNRFDLGLKARKAIYRPFPQSVPAAYVIDDEYCRQCWRCVKACDVDAIDFDMKEEEIEIDVGAIIVAIGFDEFDAGKLGNYGFGRFQNVITSLELERMLNASGSTNGHVVRPSDHKTPKNITFVQCVGARGEGGRHYCSRFCCMNAVKDSMLIRQHDPQVEEITILYSDLRAFGKGFDDFVERSKSENSATYLRGRPAKIDLVPGTDSLELFVENTTSREQLRLKADLVVLSLAAAPRKGAVELAEILGIDTDTYGFISRKDPAVSAVETSREGVFVCGSASGPEVIPDCVAQASAAASRSQLFLNEHRIDVKKADIEQLDLSGPPRIGVVVCHCGINIAGVLDVDELVEYSSEIPDVVIATGHQFTCSGTGQDAIVELIKEHNLNRIVVAACTPRTHEPVFRDTCSQIGFNPYMFEMVNIRDQCSWVHSKSRKDAQVKARDLIRMGVARARNLNPLYEGEAPMQRAALVIGGGIAGIESATDLAAQGFEVTLVEKEARLGGRLDIPFLKCMYPNMRPASEVMDEKLDRLKNSGARVLLETDVDGISGYVGNFEAKLSGKSNDVLHIGAIILAIGADLYVPVGEYGYGKLDNVITSEQFENLLMMDISDLQVDGKRPINVTFIQCVGSRDPNGFTGCSRYCCPTAIKQAIQLAEIGINVTILHRGIRTVSAGAEEMYRKARGLGVLFIRHSETDTPSVIGDEKATAVRCKDDLLGKTLEIPTDLVVLSVGMRPRQPETHKFHDMLKTSLGLDGFFLELHPELAPVETAVEGVFIAGTVQGPKDIVDSVAQASAAAAKAATLLAHDNVRLDPAVSVVDEEKCRGCGKCAEICLFKAPSLHEVSPGVFTARINASMCKGCGTCASWCPSGAISAMHFTDAQINAMIDAALPVEAKL